MAQYHTHATCVGVLSQILGAFEAGGYTRLVTTVTNSVLFDSNPAPGYVPGVKGKKETGVEYVPKGDGTRVHFYYGAGGEPTEKAKEQQRLAAELGFDPNEFIGNLVSIRRAKDGGLLVMIRASNREAVKNEDGKYVVVMGKPVLRTFSLKNNPTEGGGIMAAMALDQMMGIPYHQLKAMLNAEKDKYWPKPREIQD